MAFANSRAAARPRASFQAVGGTQIFFRHPILAGQISSASPVDEIDVSKSLRLNDTFLDANPTHDSSFQEVMVDGSTVTITNHLMNGEMTLQVLRTSELVGDGDFISALHLIIASKDSLGGVLTRIKEVNGKRIVTTFYGVSAKRVPHLKEAGNAVVPYPVVLMYAGWVQGVSAVTTDTKKIIWAVGNSTGIQAHYKPYSIQKSENSANYYGGKPLSANDLEGMPAGDQDSADGDFADDLAVPAPDGLTGVSAVVQDAANSRGQTEDWGSTVPVENQDESDSG